MELIKKMLSHLPQGKDRKPAIVLLLVPIIFTIWKYQGSPEFFDVHLSGIFSQGADLSFLRILYYGICSFILLFVIPALTVKYVLKEKITDYGVKFADAKFGLLVLIIAYPIILVTMIPVGQNPLYRALNPMYPDAGKSVPVFIMYAFVYLLYYIGWEFFFRGFMLFGLREKFGDFFAVMIQTVPSVIAHIGRPESEMFSSIIAGIAFGYLVLKSRSLWYVIILHWFIGLGCDLICIMAR